MHLPIAVLKVLKSTYPGTYNFALQHAAPHRESAVMKRVPLDSHAEMHMNIIKGVSKEASRLTLRNVYRGKRDPRGMYCVKSDAVHYTVYPAYYS